MSALVVAHPGRPAYGADELKRVAHRYGFLALVISALIHFTVIGGYYLNALFESDSPILPNPPKRLPEFTFDSHPRIPGVYELPLVTEQAIPKTGGKGTPVPVEDDPVTVENTIASQRDLVESVDPHGIVDLPGERSPKIAIDDNLPPEIFVPVEKPPVIVKAVPPVYPPLALRAGIEGKVYVKIWVDRQGKPRQVEVVKSDNDIFNEAAIEAARQLVFTPAYMNNGPVSVWVGMPIAFRLSTRE
jgi:TonB family protein